MQAFVPPLACQATELGQLLRPSSQAPAAPFWEAPDTQVQLLVEVAVVDAAIPPHADGVAAHEAGRRVHIEALDQHLLERPHTQSTTLATSASGIVLIVVRTYAIGTNS